MALEQRCEWRKEVSLGEPSRQNNKPKSSRKLPIPCVWGIARSTVSHINLQRMNEWALMVFSPSTLCIRWWPQVSYFPEELQFYEFYSYKMIHWSCNKMWFGTHTLEKFSIININSAIRKNVLYHLSQFGFHKASI